MALYMWQGVLATLLAACLGSFAWAMRYFFIQPAGQTAGMQLIKFTGSAFGILHLILILREPTIPTSRGVIGAVLYAASLVLFWWAIRANRATPLSAVFSPNLPVHMVEAGPYRYVRHPFYASYLLCWLGGVAGTAEPWLMLTVAIMFGVYVKAARDEEEKFRRSGLDGEYAAYRSRAGLFTPRLAPLFKKSKAAE
jgi:protein-S-isoprenylcysteine O-methyltransferase Ste14